MVEPIGCDIILLRLRRTIVRWVENISNVRIAILLDHSDPSDSRVQRQTWALGELGYDVSLFTLQHYDAPPAGAESGWRVPVTAARLDARHFQPIPQMLLRGARSLRARFRKGADSSATMPAGRLADRNAQRSVPSYHHTARRPPRFISWLNRVFAPIAWHRAAGDALSQAVGDFEPDVVIANDLSTLGAGVVLKQRTGARLLYDAHEFEQSRNNTARGLPEFIRRQWEPRLIRHADAVITVGEGISAWMERLHAIDRPDVVLNVTPPIFGPSITRQALGVPETALLLLYVGSAVPGRGLGRAIRALADIREDHANVILGVAGHIEDTDWDTLSALAQRHDVESAVLRIAPVAHDRVIDLLACADASLIPISPGSESYRLGMPNKLFQSLQAGTPVVTTPLPEIAATLSVCGGGVVAADFSSHAFADAVRTALQGVAPAACPDIYSAAASARRLQSIVSALVDAGLDDGKAVARLPDLARYPFDPAWLDSPVEALPNRSLRSVLACTIVTLTQLHPVMSYWNILRS